MIDILLGKTATDALRNKCIAAFCLLMLVFLVFASFPQGALAAPDGADIRMDISGGYEDKAKIGSHVPFVVLLSNQGEEISGELQVLVSIDSDRRAAYAAPVNLPEGSSKEIVINVPVYSANRKVEVRLVSNGKVIKTREYQFKKIIPPDTPLIGVMTDDPEPYRILNGIVVLEKSIPENVLKEYAEKMAVARAAGMPIEGGPAANMPAELAFLDSTSFPDRKETLDGFNILIIDDADVSLLKENQINAIEQWVSGGKILIIGTGANWKKSYAGLKDSLKPFSIEGSEKLERAESLGAFTEKAPPEGSLDVVTGNIGDGKVILEEGNVPLAVSYKKGKGTIAILTFDASLKPVAGWAGLHDMWIKLINSVSDWDKTALGQDYTAKIQPAFTASNFQHLVSDVPETQTPPFTTLMIIIGVYVLLMGPVVYLVLKWKDKRDWNWVVVPAASVMFMALIYLVGFKTRYTSAVVNNFSLININRLSRTMDISTSMALFNNQRSNMRVEYDRGLGLEINPINQYYYGMNMITGYPEGDQKGRVVSKFIDSDPAAYELYDVRMWEPKLASVYHQRPFQGEFIDEVSIKDGKFKAVIRNSTGFDMYDAFIGIGSNFASIGDIPAGGEKVIEVDLGSANVERSFRDFLDTRYPWVSYPRPQNTLPDDWKENSRKRNIFDSAFSAIYYSPQGQSGIYFFALNYDDLGYDLTINRKKPEKYSTNLIYSNIGFDFKSGSNVDIPAGIIKPVLVDSKGAYYEDRMNGSITIYEGGDVEFMFALPAGIKAEYFKISWSAFLSYYARNGAQGQNQSQLPNNTYKFYIYNYATQQWEETEKDFIAGSNQDSYILNGEIRVKANVTLDKTTKQAELVSPPDIEIKGVVE